MELPFTVIRYFAGFVTGCLCSVKCCGLSLAPCMSVHFRQMYSNKLVFKLDRMENSIYLLYVKYMLIVTVDMYCHLKSTYIMFYLCEYLFDKTI